MVNSLALSSSATSLILAVAQTNAKIAIGRDFLRPLGPRISRWKTSPPNPSTTTVNVPTDASKGESPPGNVVSRLYRQWHGVPQVIRFFVAGNLANLGFFYMERQIYNLISHCPPERLTPFLREHQDGVSFFIGYLLQIISTHLLLAVLVYGIETIDTAEKYYRTLSGQFYAYALALVGSTILNTQLMRMGLPKTTAFLGTMLVFACINYFLIGWIVRRAVETASHHSTGDAIIRQQVNQDGSGLVAMADAVKGTRRKENFHRRRQQKQEQPPIAAPSATKHRKRGFGEVMMKTIQRGGAGFILHGNNNSIGHHSPVENRLATISLQEYVMTTGSTPISVEKVNNHHLHRH